MCLCNPKGSTFMGKTQTLIKNTFNDYFDRLEEMAKQVAHLKQLSNEVTDPLIHEKILHTIDILECKIEQYADELEKDGTELMSVA